MEKKDNNSFIFFLCLEDSLTNSFYVFDRTLRDLGYILVPVKIDQLQSLVSSSEQDQVIVLSSVIDSREFKMFNEKVRPFLKYILKSKRITFMQLSSFSKINDTKFYSLTKNYYFLKYPLDARLLAAKIARYYDLKSEKTSRWPGGTRSTIKAMAA